MGTDRSFMGILSPVVAVIGDIVIGLVITYLIVGPILFAFRRISEPVEKYLWTYATGSVR